jgi:hypothetical protein
MSNRIRAGFHRLGIALAILPGLAAVGLMLWGAYDWSRPLIKPPKWQITHEKTAKKFQFSYGTDREVLGKRMQETFAPESGREREHRTIASLVLRTAPEPLWVVAGSVGDRVDGLGARLFPRQWQHRLHSCDGGLVCFVVAGPSSPLLTIGQAC